MAYMLFPMNVLPFSLAPMGGEGTFRAFNTIGINTTHTSVRGT
jgi:hypothetical protein